MHKKIKYLLLLMITVCANHVLTFDITGGAVKDRVTTTDGKPVAYLTIRLQEDKRERFTETNEQRAYLLKNVKPAEQHCQ
ncbi:hypothetical protein A8C56_03285 [Niabella ginsenosidivorans]|uniref:TNase-like domain-containing protein n=1 Tax=Niabella ginsenosidivorans TaxID=1176587 RepID=A0A1A9HXM3_9BACT|nr:hypothetical protein [Niabella ginsenosidivorans]ANH80136.1 hypothetical protein A8C56_03285 [Niabella ginsenosidivorans]